MYDECLKRAMAVDPKLISFMKEIEPEYHALQDKLRDMMKVLLKTEIVDEDDQPAEIAPEHQAQFDQEHAKLQGIIGMAAAVGWFTALECEDTHDAQVHAHAMFQMMQSKLNEGDAYRYLFKMQKH